MNIFKRTKKELSSAVNSVVQDSLPSKKSLVQEIHDSFENEIHAVLEDLSIRKELETANENLQVKCDQLKSLGFVNTPEVLAIEKLKEENNKKIKENERKQKMHDGILYFQQKYPLYKIITLDSLKMLCEKYQLGYAAISGFAGVVPQKNLYAMLEFKIDQTDKAILRHGSWWGDKAPSESQIVEAHRNLDFITSYNYSKKRLDNPGALFSPLIIAAPPKDFTDDYQKNKFGKMEPIKNLEDPIVMQPVEYNDFIYCLIITAWGPEASDPEVVNQLMN